MQRPLASHASKRHQTSPAWCELKRHFGHKKIYFITSFLSLAFHFCSIWMWKHTYPLSLSYAFCPDRVSVPLQSTSGTAAWRELILPRRSRSPHLLSWGSFSNWWTPIKASQKAQKKIHTFCQFIKGIVQLNVQIHSLSTHRYPDLHLWDVSASTKGFWSLSSGTTFHFWSAEVLSSHRSQACVTADVVPDVI